MDFPAIFNDPGGSTCAVAEAWTICSLTLASTTALLILAWSKRGLPGELWKQDVSM